MLWVPCYNITILWATPNWMFNTLNVIVILKGVGVWGRREEDIWNHNAKSCNSWCHYMYMCLMVSILNSFWRCSLISYVASEIICRRFLASNHKHVVKVYIQRIQNKRWICMNLHCSIMSSVYRMSSILCPQVYCRRWLYKRHIKRM